MKVFVAIIVFIMQIMANGYLIYHHDFKTLGWYWLGALTVALNNANRNMKY